VLETSVADDVRVLLLDCPPLLRRAGLYGDANGEFGDNDVRFALLSAAALRVADAVWEGPPDVLHAHDWHAALAVAYARLAESEPWRDAVSVLTVHNLAFPGVFARERAPLLGLPEQALRPDAFGHGDSLNLLKGGIAYADRVTTVSPTYAREVLTPELGCGLERSLLARSNDLVGIANGIDTQTWDPSRDRALAARYDAHDATGRLACKTALAAELGLDLGSDAPLLGVVSRLTPQKGVDLLLEIAPSLVEQGARLAIVALGDSALERRIAALAARWPSRVAFRPVFGDPIARRVYAGADLFVMPSRFEPCGLGQQCAMRYGAVPVARRTGGLADTIEQVDEGRGTGTGFLYAEATPDALATAIARALEARRDAALWPRIVRAAMLRDASWDASARRYFAMYRELVGAPPRPSLPPPRPVRHAPEPE
jgi:starch synthase